MAIYIQFIPEEKSFDIHTAIREKIAERKIRTWKCKDNRFTHKPRQWERNVWLNLAEKRGIDWVRFDVEPGSVDPVTKMEYSIASGRFVEMLLNHFSNYIENIRIEPFEK